MGHSKEPVPICGTLAATAAGDDVGVDLEAATVSVQQILLGDDQIVAPSEILRGGGAAEWQGCGQGAVWLLGGAAAFDGGGVDVESAAVGVQQILLGNDQIVACGDITLRLSGYRFA